MTLSVKQSHSNNRALLLRPCCSFSHATDAQVGSSGKKPKVLWLSLGILATFFLAELSTGLWSGSLSLLADAGHLLSDIFALALTLIATWLAQRPAANRATFGHRRGEILAALINGLSLLALAAFIAWEAVEHFHFPGTISGLPMLIVAGVGLAVNSVNIALLYKASRNDLNLRAAFLHVVADAVSSVGLIFAALAVYFWNWVWADAAVSLLIACSITIIALPLLQQSVEILMEYAPRSVDPAQVEAFLNSFAAIESVEKLHIWTITSGEVSLCAHLIVNSSSTQQRDRLLRQLQAQLEQEFGIRESILQLTSNTPTEAIALHPLFERNLTSIFNKKNKDCDCL